MTGSDPLIEALWERRPQEAVPIIDAHAHCTVATRGSFGDYFTFDGGAAGMVRVMDRCGVGKTLLTTGRSIRDECRAGNEATAAVVDAFPDRFRGYIRINPFQDPAGELEHWRGDARFVGLKVHPRESRHMLDSPRYQPVWEFAATEGYPVLSHTWFPEEEDDMVMVRRVAEAHPDVVLIAGHAGGTPYGVEAMIGVAADCENVILEFCGSLMRGDGIKKMVDALGAHRVIYGSDFPDIDLRFSLGRVLYAELGREDRAQVLGGTMRALFERLQPRRPL